MTPVIFIHTGDSWYLKYSIKQAEKFNSQVILIGDERNKKYARYWENIELFSSELYKRFEKAYTHMSTNAYQFELMCFKRYFIAYAYMQQNNLSNIWLADSDCLIYEDLSSLNMYDYDVAFSSCKNQDNYRWSASPHCSYWSIEALKKYIDFLFCTYEKENKRLIEKMELP
ncbi:MAG: hypothetical protein LIO41_04525 [Ruminococcus sp.]|nr:hypothetical protein [Ruminococcus sp.]